MLDVVCGVGRSVNFPTTDAKDPNPSAHWSQLTEEDVCTGRIGVERPTASSDMTQLSSLGVNKPTLSFGEYASDNEFNDMFRSQVVDLFYTFQNKAVPWHQSIVLRVSSSRPVLEPRLSADY